MSKPENQYLCLWGLGPTLCLREIGEGFPSTEGTRNEARAEPPHHRATPRPGSGPGPAPERSPPRRAAEHQLARPCCPGRRPVRAGSRAARLVAGQLRAELVDQV